MPRVRLDFLILSIGFTCAFCVVFLSLTPFRNEPAPVAIHRSSDVAITAFNYFNTGEFERGIRLFDTMLAVDPDNIEALRMRAHTFRYFGKYQEAESLLLRAAEADPSDVVTFIELGKLYRNMSRYDDSEKALLHAVELKPDYGDIYDYGLGYLYIETGDLKKAEEAITRALKLRGEHHFTYNAFGDLYRMQGENRKAEDAFLHSIALDARSEAYIGLGFLYLNEDRFEDAINAFKRYLNNVRPKSEVYTGLGYAYLNNGELENARTAFLDALSLQSDLESAKNGLAQVEILLSSTE
ncbi:hypothetical protein COU17_02895 [Candidatus Kaiserbacteria bacterium CG10_big_fil_rev_8_21_14_0_10_49_17]|uniref:Uncharacterized protein n=1 Tax=Candidatus Kaiserbacteria bacterium CG10_big_fil_rev_8_21_14_0_10_49_17 TaxID=1974609 RepID=A0A2M6WE03_9BACT|nr:MAG: hypothetical protein COU17_02895 [Candidatus Kaiserbacteria bacterium CG10_big_fil_rev_8_21_14_0_10_49_17]